MNTILIDLNGTLERGGELNEVLADRIRARQGDFRFVLWTGNPMSGRDFLASNNLLELFSDIRVKTDRITAEMLIDDDPLILSVTKKFVTKGVHIDDFMKDPEAFF